MPETKNDPATYALPAPTPCVLARWLRQLVSTPPPCGRRLSALQSLHSRSVSTWPRLTHGSDEARTQKLTSLRSRRADLLSTQPGRDDDPEDPERVGELRGLFGLARRAAQHRHGHLLEPQLLLERLEDDLRGVEAVLAQIQPVQLRDPYRPEAVGAVADPDARQERDQLREE